MNVETHLGLNAILGSLPAGDTLRDIVGAPGRLPDGEVDRIAGAIRRYVQMKLEGMAPIASGQTFVVNQVFREHSPGDFAKNFRRDLEEATRSVLAEQLKPRVFIRPKAEGPTPLSPGVIHAIETELEAVTRAAVKLAHAVVDASNGEAKVCTRDGACECAPCQALVVLGEWGGHDGIGGGR